MATLKFFIRTSKTDRNKLVNIRARLRHGNIDLYGSTGLNTEPDHWNSDKEHVINSKKATYGYEVNKKLRDLNTHILEQFASHTGEYDKDWLNDIIDRHNNPDKYLQQPKTLFEFMQDYIDRNKTKSTKGGYDRILFFLQEYSEHIKKDIDFKDITLDFYHDFKAYLENVQKHSANYISKNIKILKVFLNAAAEDGYNDYTHYRSKRFKAVSEDVDNIYLSEDEIQKIFELDLSHNKEWGEIRDTFIAGCWVGLRHSDWHKINYDNIEDGFLTLKQQKTGGVVVIPLHEMADHILRKYNGLLPSHSKEKTNLIIKEIAKKAGINNKEQKTITKAGITRTVSYEKWQLTSTHTARRSMATNLYKQGLPSYTIMQVTGHKTETAFLKYIKVTPMEHAQKLKEFWQNRPLMKVV